MSKIIIIILAALALLLLINNTQGQHIITWSNDVTNDNFLKPTISAEQDIMFTVSTIDVSTHHWFRNGVEITHDFSTYTTSWDNWGDVAEITYHGEALGGALTDNLTWEPVIIVTRATSTAIPVDTTRSNDFINATDDMDLELMLSAQMYMYTDTMGVLFFLFIIGVPMTLVYIRTESLLLPGILGVIFGGFLTVFLPTAYQTPMIILIVVSIAGIIMALFKERTT